MLSSTGLSPGSAIGRFAIGEEPMSAVLPGNPGAVATVVGARRQDAAPDIRSVEPEFKKKGGRSRGATRGSRATGW
jgi:hypothetical protein